MPQEKFSLKLIAFLSGFDGFTAYSVILGILFACGLGVPIPEDITLIAAGILAALGKISLMGAIIVGMIGVLIGDAFLFFVGRHYGYRVFKLPVFRSIFTEERIRLAKARVHANSKFICFTARFLPGLRSPIFLTAGILGVRPIVFFALDGFAALISVPIWVYVGWYVGGNLDNAMEVAGRAQKYVIVAVVVLVLTYILYKKWVSARKKEALESEPEIAALKGSVTPSDSET